MPALGFTDQRGRLRLVVQNALRSATYDSSHSEDEGRSLLIEAHRDAKLVRLRFRGVKESTASQEIEPGSALKLGSVGGAGGFSLVGLFFPMARRASSGYARVRIDAGGARLDVICQDAEWWEEDATPGGV